MHLHCFKRCLFLFLFLFTHSSPSLSLRFLPANNVSLFGDASFSNNSISLTQEHSCAASLSPPEPPPASPSTNATSLSGVGRAFYVNPIRFLDSSTNAAASFLCSFSFEITPSPACPYGDGLAFLITSNTGSFSLTDGYMGLPEQALETQDSFIAVEFDTNYNPSLDDVNDNHIAVDVDKLKSLAAVDAVSRGVDLKSGKEMSAWIEYRDTEKMIRVWLGYSQIRPASPVLAARVDLSKQFKELMHVGFSASNGRGSAIHTVNRWRFKTFGSLPSVMMPMDKVGEGDCLVCFPGDVSDISIVSVTRHINKRALVIGIGLGGFAVLIVIAIVVIVVCICIARRKKLERAGDKSQILRFQGNRVPKRLSLHEIKAATKGFNQDKILGEGASAIVYEGQIPSCGAVAVKRFNQESRLGSSSSSCIPFNTEFATMLGCLRHKNLIQLQGWCCEKNELVLVYEHMSNGSLDKILHQRTYFAKYLTWERRLNIVLGVASALVYLHEECESQIIHRDVKTCNIMLDEQFNAKLGDFGLAEVYRHNSRTRDATVPAGTMGYLAPEYAFSGISTAKSDVYSFGIVVLEVASGRRPVEEEGSVITEWVWTLWEMGKLTEAADPKLMGHYNRVEMERMLRVGLFCAHPNHEQRPTMREAARMLRGEAPLPFFPQKKPTVRIQSVLPEGCEEIMSLGGELDNTPWSTPGTHFSKN